MMLLLLPPYQSAMCMMPLYFGCSCTGEPGARGGSRNSGDQMKDSVRSPPSQYVCLPPRNGQLLAWSRGPPAQLQLRRARRCVSVHASLQHAATRRLLALKMHPAVAHSLARYHCLS